jgi:hypothetical protein
MALKRLPFRNVSVVLKHYLSTEEDVKTAALIRELRNARLRGLPHTSGVGKGVSLEITTSHLPHQAQQRCTSAGGYATGACNAERAPSA